MLVTAISAAFVAMIRAFLLTILLAAIFAGLGYPVYQWILVRVRGRMGPILAALFLTVWDLFGIAFRTSLAEPTPRPADDRG